MSRKKKRNSSVPSEEEVEDDIPLKVLKISLSHDIDPHSYDSLCMPSEEPCELCDQVSRNRYLSIIHNVRHIIIPLLNQKVCQCKICLHHFTSQNDLKCHLARKHTLKELINVIDLPNRNFNNPKDGLHESDLISIVKEEKIDTSVPIDQFDNIDQPVKIEQFDNIDRFVKIDQSDSKDQLDTKKNIVKLQRSEGSSESFSLKNRLMFEEDIISLDSDRLLTDLTTDCHVKVELFPPIWDVEAPKSVGYDELVKPGVFRCKKCGKTFPSRYEAIIHEAYHINIKTNISNNATLCRKCNLYIVGDYSRVMKHNNTSHPKPNVAQDITRLQFGGNGNQNGAYELFSTKVTSLKLCELCFSFCKNNLNINYNYIQELREDGKRYMCDKCGGKFFDIYSVKREVKCSALLRKKKNTNKKFVSNKDRLKIIQKRLKLLKKLYFVVLFTTYLIIIFTVGTVTTVPALMGSYWN